MLGARTNRYGDFLDIACAIAGRAPDYGLHRPENRRATLLVDLGEVSSTLKQAEAFYPVLGTWLGLNAGTDIAVIDGLQGIPNEDNLKALGAASASAGGVGLFHVAGVTPEAPDTATALGFQQPQRILKPSASDLARAHDRLSTIVTETIDAVAIGSPHLSLDEAQALERLLQGRRVKVPFYACTGRHVIRALDETGTRKQLETQGIIFVADTCVVVTPMLPDGGGVLMTNSGKFAHYAPGNTGYAVTYGALKDCVESAVTGRLQRDESLWP